MSGNEVVGVDSSQSFLHSFPSESSDVWACLRIVDYTFAQTVAVVFRQRFSLRTVLRAVRTFEAIDDVMKMQMHAVERVDFGCD